MVDAQGQAVRAGDDVGVEDLVRAHQLGQADDLGGLYPGQHAAAPFVGGADISFFIIPPPTGGAEARGNRRGMDTGGIAEEWIREPSPRAACYNVHDR